jgi:hypothetical protein
MEGAYICHQWVEKTYQLEPGYYIVYLKDDNKNKREEAGNFGLSIYGEFPCKIQPSTKKDCINFLPEYFLDASMQKGRRQ